jgi:hypothetical protein
VTRLVIVDRQADAPPPARGTEILVLDAAWTATPRGRADVLPIRPIVQAIVDEVDVIDGALAALDGWAAAAGLPDAFAVDGLTWWYRARMLLRWQVQELVLWRLVLDQLAPPGRHATVAVPAGRPGVIAAARAGLAAANERTGNAQGPTIEVIGAEPAPQRVVRGLRRRASRLVQRFRPPPAETTARVAALEGRLAALSGDHGGVLALAWPRAFQVVGGDGDRERRVDPYLVGALDRLEADGERIVTVGLGLDPRRDEDWAIVANDPRMLPERFLVDRIGAAESLGIDSRPVTEAVLRAAAVSHHVRGIDLGPSFAALVAPYAGRWLERQRLTLRGAEAALSSLAPATIFTDREGSRAAWLAAGRRTGVRSVAVQHGMIYPNNPEYFQAPHPGRLRPDVTCVFGDYERDLLVRGAGFPAEDVVVTGSPRPLVAFGSDGAADRAAVRRELGVRDTDRLLLVSVAHNEVLGELHTFGLLERTLGGPLPGIHLVFKLHPQDRAESRHEELLVGLAAARGYEPPRLSIVREADLYRLLRAADAHLGQYSTVLSDAVVAGTPNMIAVGQAHADALDYVAAGVATPVTSVEDVLAFMANPQPPDPAARQRFLDAHYRPGDAIGRLADVLRGAGRTHRPTAEAERIARRVGASA